MLSNNCDSLEFISSALCGSVWHSFNMPRSGADKIFSRLLIVRSQVGCLDCQLTYSSTDGNCGHTKIPISGSCVPSLSLSLPLSCLIFGIFKACIDCCGHSTLNLQLYHHLQLPGQPSSAPYDDEELKSFH